MSRTGSLNWSMARLPASSRHVRVPPASTNALRAATPASPSPPTYSGGAEPGRLPDSRRSADADGRMMTSYCLRRSPARTRVSLMLVNRNSCRSNNQRVHPSSALSVHGLYSATRAAPMGFTATDSFRLTPSARSPRSAVILSISGRTVFEFITTSLHAFNP